jgi:hypothetical protein
MAMGLLRTQIGMFRPIRMDHTNCLQVAIKSIQFNPRAHQGRSWSTDCLRTLSSLIFFSRNCQSSSLTVYFFKHLGRDVLTTLKRLVGHFKNLIDHFKRSGDLRVFSWWLCVCSYFICASSSGNHFFDIFRSSDSSIQLVPLLSHGVLQTSQIESRENSRRVQHSVSI